MKKGVAHVEVIIAFILFGGFLFFGLYFFNPLNTSRVLDSTLYYAKDEIVKNITGKVEIYGLKVLPVENDISPYYVKIPAAVFGDINLFRGVRVENNEGVAEQVYLEGGAIYFGRGSLGFVRFIFGDFTTHQTRYLRDFVGRDGLLGPEQYVISSNDVRTVYSERAALVLADQYWRNYDQVKEQFNLPRRVDFDFSITTNGKTLVNATKEVPEQVEVYATQQRVEVIKNATGELLFADLNVRVW